jgi:voltage-gated potassium channel
VIDANPEHAEEARHVGVRFVGGSASEDETLLAAGIERARAVVACIDSDAENVFVALSARQLNDAVPIIARASNPETEPKLLRAGATRVISPYRASGTEMARAALTPQVAGSIEVTPEYRFEEIEVEDGSRAAGRTVGDVRGDAIIVGVRRSDGSFLPQPPGATGLRAGDVMLALGQLHTLERLERALAP